MTVTLKTYSFTITLTGTHELTPEITDALYEAGCDDAGVGTCDGVLTVEFDREAESLAVAVETAIRAVEAAGFTMARIDFAANS